MTRWTIAIRSLFHYLRQNLAVALGVATATAVLTGALIVGDSMRGSLRDLTLDRLGKIDELIISDGFFREQLASELAATDAFKADYSQAVPIILFPNGTIERESDSSRVTNVNVLGVTDAFWSLGSVDLNAPADVSGRRVVINQKLANEMGPTKSAGTLTLRIPKPTQLPTDSALAKTSDLVESLADLEVAAIIPDKSLGRFGLQPSQTDSPNIYVPIGLLQDALARSTFKQKQDSKLANAILLSGKDGRLPGAAVTAGLLAALRPTLADFGLTVKRVTQSIKGKTIFDYYSLSCDRLMLPPAAVAAAKQAIPDSKEIFVYLANDISKADQASGAPFSMVASIDFDDQFQPVSVVTGKPVKSLAMNEIVINDWTGVDLRTKVGDEIVLSYFDPETTHGNQTESTAKFILADVVKLTEPVEPFRTRGRGQIEPAVFDSEPTIVNDPDLTPEVPGVTDADSIEKWDLPFATADKIRPQDDEYWNDYRTTPKAFISLAAGRKLWSSRFGDTTSMRIPISAGTVAQVGDRLLAQLDADQTKLGFEIVPIKRNGLAASSGSTPFDVLFLALSMFVIGSALILVSLLFRLGLQSRANEIGVMQAIGFPQKRIVGLWLREMLVVCAVGALLGIVIGIGYAWLMIWGLTTLWIGAISNPFLTLHIGPLSLLIGLLSGILICVVTIWWSLRRTRRQSITGLLSGQLESTPVGTGKSRGWLFWIACLLLVAAIGLSVAATKLAGDPQAGAFMGSGFLVLTALLMLIYQWLRKRSGTEQASSLSLGRLAAFSAKRNPLRSTLTIGLVAVASFLIVAVSSFRLSPTDAGTAGFDLIGESSQPIFADLNTEAGQVKLLGRENLLPPETRVFALRVKPGQDASCNNLYQSTQPRVLGVSEKFIDYFDSNSTPFGWGAVEATTAEEKANPWQLLQRTTDDGAIPVIIDQNTANYSLKIFATGGDYEVTYDSGEKVKFRVVGFLSNTILQGSLVISEKNFVRAFPNLGGYRYFLIAAPGSGEGVGQKLESRLGDQGFDARSATEVLANFMQVQNTYLSTFQSLGALGLLLGTLGLAVVEVRNVVERKQELGLLRAVGFSKAKLSKLVLLENASLLLFGLGTGIVSAIFATLPHYFIGSASVPWLPLFVMLTLIGIVGILSGRLAARLIGRLPLLESLRV